MALQFKYPVRSHGSHDGPVRGKSITTTQADAAIKFVMRKFTAWSDKYDDDYNSLGWDGTGIPGDVPTLYWNYDDKGNAAIVWEGNSPYEWTYAIEETFIDQEFGFRVEPKGEFPKGVFAEPKNGYVLMLYRED